MWLTVPDYFNRVNQDLLAVFIPPYDAKTVLEIGCGAGAAMAEALRRVNPGVLWNGFDNNDAALEVARTRCSHAANVDVNKHWRAIAPQYADVVVFGDVLEHLSDPWIVLKYMAENMAPGAQVLACIPNVQHWTVIRDLLNGKWTYTDENLLDRTHLRFFTLDSIQDMFAEAGLQVFEIQGRDIDNEGHHHFLSFIDEIGPEACHQLGVDLNPLRKQSFAFQYLVRAIKPPESDI